MAYSSSKYQLTHLLQDVWFRLGQMKRWSVTGGDLDSIINTAWAGVEELIYEDDDPALIYGTAVVIKSTDGAAPEGEFARITNYDSASQTIDHDGFTTAVGSGDKIGIAAPAFPLEDMIEAANIAIVRLGELEVPDTSITATPGVYEYTLPAAIRAKPLAVNSRASSNEVWKPVQGWGVIPATAGSNWTLVLPTDFDSNIQIVYRAHHPKLSAYDSDILDTIHPELATCAVVAEALQWYNNQVGGSNQYFLQRENKALQDLESAMVRFPIPGFIEQFQGMPHWNRRSEYVPGTSDRMY